MRLLNKMLDDPTLSVNVERAEGTFASWMRTIIHHACIDELETFFFRNARTDQDIDPDRIATPFWDFEKASDLLWAVTQLPEPQRRAVELRIANTPQGDVAEIMDLSVDQVRDLLEKARKRLGRILAVSRKPRRGRP